MNDSGIVLDLSGLTNSELREYSANLLKYWRRCVENDYFDGAKKIDSDLLGAWREVRSRGRRYTLGWPELPRPGAQWDPNGFWMQHFGKVRP